MSKCHGAESGHSHEAIMFRSKPCPLCACLEEIEKLKGNMEESEGKALVCPSCGEVDGFGRRLHGCNDPEGCGV